MAKKKKKGRAMLWKGLWSSFQYFFLNQKKKKLSEQWRLASGRTYWRSTGKGDRGHRWLRAFWDNVLKLEHADLSNLELSMGRCSLVQWVFGQNETFICCLRAARRSWVGYSDPEQQTTCRAVISLSWPRAMKFSTPQPRWVLGCWLVHNENFCCWRCSGLHRCWDSH